MVQLSFRKLIAADDEGECLPTTLPVCIVVSFAESVHKTFKSTHLSIRPGDPY